MSRNYVLTEEQLERFVEYVIKIALEHEDVNGAKKEVLQVIETEVACQRGGENIGKRSFEIVNEGRFINGRFVI